jgi:hypothetical protein
MKELLEVCEVGWDLLGEQLVVRSVLVLAVLDLLNGKFNFQKIFFFQRQDLHGPLRAGCRCRWPPQ